MIDLVAAYTIPAAMSLLPAEMNTPAAQAMLIAIGMQESRFRYRRQIGGPARSFWMFERAGVRGVAMHAASTAPLTKALDALCYPAIVSRAQITACHSVLEHQDVLACCFARLLLWTLPNALPSQSDPEEGWRQYLEAWRPGKPHPGTWGGFYQDAWLMVNESGTDPEAVDGKEDDS